ncbi:unnamed protein product, partial [Adineta ricciae]
MSFDPVRAIFNQVDTNRDGNIDRSEFNRWVGGAGGAGSASSYESSSFNSSGYGAGAGAGAGFAAGNY